MHCPEDPEDRDGHACSLLRDWKHQMPASYYPMFDFAACIEGEGAIRPPVAPDKRSHDNVMLALAFCAPAQLQTHTTGTRASRAPSIAPFKVGMRPGKN